MGEEIWRGLIEVHHHEQNKEDCYGKRHHNEDQHQFKKGDILTFAFKHADASRGGSNADKDSEGALSNVRNKFHEMFTNMDSSNLGEHLSKKWSVREFFGNEFFGAASSTASS